MCLLLSVSEKRLLISENHEAILLSTAAEPTGEGRRNKLIGDDGINSRPASGKRTVGGVAIEFRNYSARYPHCSKNVLENIILYIDSGQKISIIGRTGSGGSRVVGWIENRINVKSTFCTLCFEITYNVILHR